MNCICCGTKVGDYDVFCASCGFPPSQAHQAAYDQTPSPQGAWDGRVQRVRGKVKWFNNTTGCGSIGLPQGPDVFVHYSMIMMDGFKTLQEGDSVEFEIVQGKNGPMAFWVTKVGVPTEEMPRVRGIVRWFDNNKGYGVIGCGAAPDVFVSYSSIMVSGYKSLLAGDIVEFSVVEGADGPMAVRVTKVREARTRTGPTEPTGRETAEDRRAKPRSARQILGVPIGASNAEITAAYHRMAQMYHPDKVASLAPEFQEMAEGKMKEINAAYEELTRKR